MKRFLLNFSFLGLAILFFNGCKGKDEIPVYQVTGLGTTQESANQLVKLLSIDNNLLKEGKYRDNNGRVAIVDTKKHLFVPTISLGDEKADEDGLPVKAEALDMSAFKSIKTMDVKEAATKFTDALRKTDLFPIEGEVKSKNNFLVIVDSAGNTVSNTAIDTRVSVDLKLGGISYEGPGAKISASFSGDASVSQLKYGCRKLAKGELVNLLDSNKVKETCRAMYNLSSPKGKYEKLEMRTRLFYYAPPLDQNKLATIIPYYECSGTAFYGDRKVELMPYIIPAITDKRYVPELSLKTSMDNNKMEAAVNITGGVPPYQIQWSSSSIGMRSGDATSITFDLFRRGKEMQEVLNIKVIDNNGVSTHLNKLILFNPDLLPSLFAPSSRDAATRDYGTENAVLNQFGGLDQGFINAMNADGVHRKFTWGGLNAWEQDFKKTEDDNWIDDTDITFYVGHGNVGLFTFENSTEDDSVLDNDDATGDWGHKDLEWLALYSCQVLGKGGDGQEPFRNWKQEFDGLHLLLGFHSNARVNNNFSGKFAANMLSSNMTVLQAWVDAVDDENVGDCVVMGVFRRSDGAWNYNDHFHGKGSVGPDISGSSIGLGWYIAP